MHAERIDGVYTSNFLQLKTLFHAVLSGKIIYYLVIFINDHRRFVFISSCALTLDKNYFIFAWSAVHVL